MKIVFMGTPDFAVPVLGVLIKNHEVAAVFTQPDKPRGRGQKLQFSPVKEVAVENNLPVFQPVKLRKEPEMMELIGNIKPDVIVVVAYGQILPKEILEIPSYGCINVHASLLPELRGAAPINWAIIRGLKKTGITTMQMDVGLDTGDMLLKREVPIGEGETAGELHDKLMKLSPELLIETLKGIEAHSIIPQKQEDKNSTYAPMMDKELGHIDWYNESDSIYNLIRGVTPFPGAYSKANGKIIKIWQAEKLSNTKYENPGQIVDVSKCGIEVACKKGSILIKEIQESGSKRMSVDSFLNGHTIDKGIKLE